MIYTLTLNPSLDYIIEAENVALGKLNRTKAERKLPGGKGINVSQVLKRLNVHSIALGFTGGFTGNFIESFLHKLDIKTDFVKVEDDTRINIKLLSVQETEINAQGPVITKENFDALLQKVQRLTNKDILVLAGSIPSSMPNNTYEEIVKICSRQETKVVIDAEGDLLRNMLTYRPFLIKPNHHELGELFQTTITTCEEAIPLGQQLIKEGAKNVIVSLAAQGAVFINKDKVFIASVPKGPVKSSVGAGDSMVAGFIAALEKNMDLEKAFRFSAAAGSATAFSTGLCTREKIESLLNQVTIAER